MSVRTAMLANLDVRTILLNTACYHCEHPYHAHQRDGGACYSDNDCDCPSFVDEFLPSTAAILRANAARREQIAAAACAHCGHPYAGHTDNDHEFIDPDEVQQ